MPARACEVAILGAGPYGLSIAAYLRSAGVAPRIFGEPMSFWQQQMPRGMLLRSSKRASNIGSPLDNFRLDNYGTAVGIEIADRVPLSDFVDYGCWFQREVIPNIDRRTVSQIQACAAGFRLTLEDGEPVEASIVVVAAGIGAFANRPPQFASVPSTLASHSSEHADLSKFAGSSVLVIGAGQSAFESAALLLERGATVELLVRERGIRWLNSEGFRGQSHLVHALLYPPTEVGPLGFNHIIARPHLFRKLPRKMQNRLTYSAIRPMVSDWLEPRLRNARIEVSRSVLSAVPIGDRLRLTFDDGSTREVDHVILATGYRVDISRYKFLSPDLLRAIRSSGGFPVLTTELESSVPGLFFVGAPATYSFGPLVRFVAGTQYCGETLAKVLVGSKGRISPTRRLDQGIENTQTNHRAVVSPKPLGALVVGGDYGALGIVRSLGRHNIPVWTFVDKYKLAGFSRYSTRTLHWPQADEARQLEFLLDLQRKHGLEGWVLFPVGDEHAALFARNRDLLARSFRVTAPSWEVMRWAYDKRLTYRLADALGLSYPLTFYPRDREEVRALECKFPAILKPGFKRTLNRFTRAKAWLTTDRNDLLRRYDEAIRLIDPNLIMVQEMIAGGGENQFSYAGLCVDGRPIASLVARRSRQFPADFGRASSFVETIEQEEIERAAKLLLEAMRYTGIVEVEFKYDPQAKSYKLLDVNARVWAWHTLGVRAGVDFPYLLWQAMQDQAFGEVHARPGEKWIHMILDVPAAASEIWRGRLGARDYIKSLADASEYAVLAKDDPLPALAEVPLMIASKWMPFLSRNGAK